MRPRSMKDVKAASEAALNQGGQGGGAATRVRGLRDVMSSRKVAGRAVPSTRSQQLGEIAWLDRELERLRREASIMEANMARVNARITEVVDRRDTVLAVIRHDLGLDMPAETPAPRAQRAEEEDEPLQVDEFSLEY
ncbi:MAG: hypothetical protein U0X20_25810 [Caldilineaceae bacterium]